jgi:N-hydroxyarylamine O-acetyltransferase
LRAYLDRIGLARPREADATSMTRLHLAHREAFLFENLSIQTGGSISLALADLERKFLDEGKGGYCFEHNTLFAAALREVGYDPVTLLGRVRRGPPESWARTHMVLRVFINGAPWLADVGFGGPGLLEPIPLRDGAESTQGGLRYSLRRDAHLWVLAMRDAGGASMDLYEFTDDPQTPRDVEVANHFTSTHPDSIFRKTLTIQRSRRAERTMLRNGAVTEYRDGLLQEDAFERKDLHAVARRIFDIELPPGPFVFDAAMQD